MKLYHLSSVQSDNSASAVAAARRSGNESAELKRPCICFHASRLKRATVQDCVGTLELSDVWVEHQESSRLPRLCR